MNSFHHLLMKSYCALRRKVMERAQGEGLTAGQPKILEFLSENEGVEQNKIARHCEIEAATAGSILNRMEAAGLIERRRLGQNRRSLYVYLTEKGQKASQKVESIFAETEGCAFCGFSEKEREQAYVLLAKLYENLTKTEEI